jgi:DedD protein
VDERLKRRLIGAAVLASLAVIFVPMLVEDEPASGDGAPTGTIPPRENLTFKSDVLKNEIAVPTDAPPPGPVAGGDADPATAPEPPVEPVAEPVAEEPAAPPPIVGAPAPAEKPLVAEKPAPAEKPKAPPPQVAKPTPPAPKPAAPAPRITTWIVQVGNYASRDKADSVARQLRGRGLEVFVEPIGSPAVFRVAVGPEAERNRAEALIPRIQAAVPGGAKPFIRSYP